MVYYPVPCHRLPVYANEGWGPFPVADALAGEVLSLPIGPGLVERYVTHIGDTVMSVLDQL